MELQQTFTFDIKGISNGIDDESGDMEPTSMDEIINDFTADIFEKNELITGKIIIDTSDKIIIIMSYRPAMGKELELLRILKAERAGLSLPENNLKNLNL